MKIVNRFIPWIAALSIFFGFLEVFKNPTDIYLVAPVCLLVMIVGIWQLTGRVIRNEKFWRFAVTPVLFVSGGALFLSFLEGLVLRQIFLVIFAFLIWVYFEVLFLWFHNRPKYQVHSLENISTNLDLLSIFFIASGLYSINIFFGISIWYLLLIFIVMSSLLTYQLIWTSEVNLKSGLVYVGIITLIISEGFLAVHHLPTSIYVNGLIITLGFYLMTGLARNWFLGIKEKKVLKRYLLVSISCLLLILVTAKWF